MNKIRKLRKQTKISALQLAGKLNITPKHLYDLETGKRRLHEDIITNIADIFDVSTDYLLGRKHNKEKDTIAETASNYEQNLEDLPAEARKSIEDYKEYIIKKYS